MTHPVIMWFRQDLRLADNAALAAAAAAGPVLPVFILDDDTPGVWRWGGASRWWLHRSLAALGARLPLVLRRGESVSALERLAAESGARAVYFSRDYAPWSPRLEQRVKAMCGRTGMKCHRYHGFLLHEPEDIRTGAEQFFKVYTPFSRACIAKGAKRQPMPAPRAAWWTGNNSKGSLDDWDLLPRRPNWALAFEEAWQPGEEGARLRLARFVEEGLPGYADGRDRPDRDHTSRLSAHLHWGEISPPQVWRGVAQAMASSAGRLDRDGEKFLKELLWREFSQHLLFHAPSLPTAPFREEFNDFPWTDDPAMLARWQRGETGYPIVDAGLRQLWTTGTMHNRVRMIAASFLVKHLLIPWQAGARWFWDTLVDADIGNNSASWQWVAGCGADAAPYFRIFNPVLQGERFDPDGAYVRRWVKELKGVASQFIHRPWEMDSAPSGYPPPLVEHGLARDRALAAFKAIRRNKG